MSQSLCVSWPQFDWMGKDHGLWIKGLGEMLVSARGDVCVEMVCAGMTQGSLLVLVMGLTQGRGISEGQSGLNITHCWEQALYNQGHVHPPAVCPVSPLSTSLLVRAGSAQVLSGDLRMNDRPFLSLPTGPFPWPTNTRTYIYPQFSVC